MQFAFAILTGLLSAIQLAIFSMPIVAWQYAHIKGPHDEFTGIAMFGYTIIVGGIAGIVGFFIGFALTLLKYKPESAVRIKRVDAALAISISTGIVCFFLFPHSNVGALAALIMSVLAFAIGLPVALQRPWEPEKRWGEE